MSCEIAMTTFESVREKGVCLLLAVASACAHAPARVEPASAASEADPVDEWPPVTPRLAADGFVAFECGLAREPEEIEADRRRRADELGFNAELAHVRVVYTTRNYDDEPFAARGEACAGARDTLGCLAKVAELETREREHEGTFAITTRGDEVAAHRGDELVALVTPIDSPAKAWLALMARAPVSSYLCGDVDWHGYRRDGAAYELVWYFTRSSCPFERVRTVSRVDADGALRRVARTVRQSKGCVVDESG
jgi:hypothetical protein